MLGCFGSVLEHAVVGLFGVCLTSFENNHILHPPCFIISSFDVIP